MKTLEELQKEKIDNVMWRARMYASMSAMTWDGVDQLVYRIKHLERWQDMKTIAKLVRAAINHSLYRKRPLEGKDLEEAERFVYEYYPTVFNAWHARALKLGVRYISWEIVWENDQNELDELSIEYLDEHRNKLTPDWSHPEWDLFYKLVTEPEQVKKFGQWDLDLDELSEDDGYQTGSYTYDVMKQKLTAPRNLFA